MNCRLLAYTLSFFLAGLVPTAQAQNATFGVQRGAQLSLNEQLQVRINNGTRTPDRAQADQWMRVGSIQQREGAYGKAISSWRTALSLYEGIGDNDGVGTALDFIGLAYGNLGDFYEAEHALRRRLGVAQTQRDFVGQIYGFNNLGTILLQSGYLPAAESSFSEALRIAKSIQHLEGEGLSLSNLGLIAAGQGDYAEAAKRYEQALLLRGRGDNPYGEANTFNNLGDAYRAMGLDKDAAAAYGEALGLARRLGDRATEYRAIDGLVVAHQATGYTQRALDLLTDRLTLSQRESDVYQQFRSIRALAQFYKAQRNREAAISFYQRAIELAVFLGEEQSETLLRDELARLDVDLAQPPQTDVEIRIRT
jgi:tetratricopeptide (TPR) repeat protein